MRRVERHVVRGRSVAFRAGYLDLWNDRMRRRAIGSGISEMETNIRQRSSIPVLWNLHGELRERRGGVRNRHIATQIVRTGTACHCPAGTDAPASARRRVIAVRCRYIQNLWEVLVGAIRAAAAGSKNLPRCSRCRGAWSSPGSFCKPNTVRSRWNCHGCGGGCRCRHIRNHRVGRLRGQSGQRNSWQVASSNRPRIVDASDGCSEQRLRSSRARRGRRGRVAVRAVRSDVRDLRRRVVIHYAIGGGSRSGLNGNLERARSSRAAEIEDARRGCGNRVRRKGKRSRATECAAVVELERVRRRCARNASSASSSPPCTDSWIRRRAGQIRVAS